LSDGDYELDLTDFEIYYTIANVNSSNNKFYFDKDKKIVTKDQTNYMIQTSQSETGNFKRYHKKKTL